MFAITDGSAADAKRRLDNKKIINNFDVKTEYSPFDPVSSIEYGIAIYLDKKRRAGGTDDVSKIYKFYNPKASVQLRETVKQRSDAHGSQAARGSTASSAPSVPRPSTARLMRMLCMGPAAMTF